MDIISHELWGDIAVGPFSNYEFDGISWGHPSIFIPNVMLLIAVYALFFFYRYKTAKKLFLKEKHV
ncbi:MAG: hypothetical protein AAB631_03080 [Patescibacteria group bacterium]